MLKHAKVTLTPTLNNEVSSLLKSAQFLFQFYPVSRTMATGKGDQPVPCSPVSEPSLLITLNPPLQNYAR